MIAGMPLARFVTTVLLAGELVGLVVFVVTYGRRANWRGSHAGRTIIAWPVAISVIIALSFAVRVWPSPFMSWTLAVAHGVFFLAVWHRVRVLRRYLRSDESEGTPDEEDPQGPGRRGGDGPGRPGDGTQDRGAAD